MQGRSDPTIEAIKNEVIACKLFALRQKWIRTRAVYCEEAESQRKLVKEAGPGRTADTIQRHVNQIEGRIRDCNTKIQSYGQELKMTGIQNPRVNLEQLLNVEATIEALEQAKEQQEWAAFKESLDSLGAKVSSISKDSLSVIKNDMSVLANSLKDLKNEVGKNQNVNAIQFDALMGAVDGISGVLHAQGLSS